MNTQLAKTISSITHPKFITPIVALILIIIFEPIQYKTIIAISITISIALIGSRIESFKEEEDTFEFKDPKLQMKRFYLLLIGIIYFSYLILIFNSAPIKNWVSFSLLILIVFLILTIVFQYKFSAHIYFNFMNIVLLSELLVFPILFILIFTITSIIGTSRVVLNKHTIQQIVLTQVICILLFVLWL